MTLHIDVPNRSDVTQLLEAKAPWCVTVYISTSPVTTEAEVGRIELKNAIGSLESQLADAGSADRGEIDELRDSLQELVADESFWAHQAHSLAVFATARGVRTYRLPNRLPESVTVAQRFHLTPFLRTVTFPQAAFLLALAQGSVRLLEISPDLPPHEFRVPEMPANVADSARKTTIADRSPQGTVQGSEGQKLRMRQYARKIDAAIRPVLSGQELPLILAAAQPLEAIYRAVNSYPHLAATGLTGNPETTSDADLAEEARRILDDLYAVELAELRERFEGFADRGRAVTELSDVVRAATYGAVDTVLLDIESDLTGSIDEESGVVDVDGDPGESSSVTDEIARRVARANGRIVAVRGDSIPAGGPAAAILRYPV